MKLEILEKIHYFKMNNYRNIFIKKKMKLIIQNKFSFNKS